MEVAGETECTLVDADEDGDGWVSDEFDGDDCYDHQPDTFPGAAEHDSESACMTDSDGDGFGSQLPGGVGVLEGAISYFYGEAENRTDHKELAKAGGLLATLLFRLITLLVAAAGFICFMATGKNRLSANETKPPESENESA